MVSKPSHKCLDYRQILKFEDQQKQLESGLSDAKRSAKVLAQELEKKREVITKKDAELSSAKDNIKMKVDEVNSELLFLT